VDRIFRCINSHPLQVVLQQTQVNLSRKLLSAVPALRQEMAQAVEPLPFRGELIGSEAIVAHSLRAVNLSREISELDRGNDFGAFNPHRLTHFGEAVEIMKYILTQRGAAEVVFTGRQGTSTVIRTDELTARGRRVTARLAEEGGRLQAHFSIYRNLDSFDYVQVAVTLPGLEVDRHPRLKNLYFLTEKT
jgi:hypothetical protein